jgi:tubulin polyglutamylase TTLL5
MREAVLVFESFDAMMNNPDLELQRKFKLSLAPLEMNPRELVAKGPEILSKLEPIDPPSEHEMYYRAVKKRGEVYDIVTRALIKKKGWSELAHGLNLKHSWNLLWTWSKPHVDMTKILVWQKVNHFQLTKNFSRKDLLKHNLEKMKKIGPKTAHEWNIMPTTFTLPKEYVNFVDAYSDLAEFHPERNIWIMKPIGKSRGRGITVINELSQVVYSEPMVIQ